MNTNKVKEILKMIEESPLDQLEIEVKQFGGKGIRVRKGSLANSDSCDVRSPNTIDMVGSSFKDTTSAKSSESESLERELNDNQIEIVSPIVGTFYRALSPDSPPYVEEGESISANQVVCIVEAMKLMNEIQSEVSGVVEKILVENNHPVEFGQVMFIINTQK
ncbi:acetyl-CoA carboxylase biotin carboxyl carrier protein [bacterium]|nr:acetyl-CoA carboxylase biotin carboxyl carrier protein [bacterium]